MIGPETIRTHNCLTKKVTWTQTEIFGPWMLFGELKENWSVALLSPTCLMHTGPRQYCRHVVSNGIDHIEQQVVYHLSHVSSCSTFKPPFIVTRKVVQCCVLHIQQMCSLPQGHLWHSLQLIPWLGRLQPVPGWDNNICWVGSQNYPKWTQLTVMSIIWQEIVYLLLFCPNFQFDQNSETP